MWLYIWQYDLRHFGFNVPGSIQLHLPAINCDFLVKIFSPETKQTNHYVTPNNKIYKLRSVYHKIFDIYVLFLHESNPSGPLHDKQIKIFFKLDSMSSWKHTAEFLKILNIETNLENILTCLSGPRWHWLTDEKMRIENLVTHSL